MSEQDVNASQGELEAADEQVEAAEGIAAEPVAAPEETGVAEDEQDGAEAEDAAEEPAEEEADAAEEDADEDLEVVELELSDDDIVRYLEDEDGNRIGFVIMEDGEEAEYLYVEDDEDDEPEHDVYDVVDDGSLGITRDGVQQATDDMNAIFKDGVKMAAEFKGAFDDIKSALDFSSLLK